MCVMLCMHVFTEGRKWDPQRTCIVDKSCPLYLCKRTKSELLLSLLFTFRLLMELLRSTWRLAFIPFITPLEAVYFKLLQTTQSCCQLAVGGLC